MSKKNIAIIAAVLAIAAAAAVMLPSEGVDQVAGTEGGTAPETINVSDFVEVHVDRPHSIPLTVTPEGSTYTAVWESADPSVATVSGNNYGCTITGVSEGETTVTVTVGELSDTMHVIVGPPFYYITWSVQGTDVDYDEWQAGDVVEPPADPQVDGMVFVGWYDYYMVKYQPGFVPTYDTTFRAQFVREGVTDVTVTFDIPEISLGCEIALSGEGVTPNGDGTYTVPAGDQVRLTVTNDSPDVSGVNAEIYYSEIVRYQLADNGDGSYSADVLVLDDCEITVVVHGKPYVQVTYDQDGIEFDVYMYSLEGGMTPLESGAIIGSHRFVIVTNIQAEGTIVVTFNGVPVEESDGEWIKMVNEDTEIRVTVSGPEGAPTGVEIFFSDSSLENGEEIYVQIAVTPAGSDYTAEWTSSDEGVVTVSNHGDGVGKITAVSDGEATITVTVAEGVTDSVTITVFSYTYNVAWIADGTTIYTDTATSNTNPAPPSYTPPEGMRFIGWFDRHYVMYTEDYRVSSETAFEAICVAEDAPDARVTVEVHGSGSEVTQVTLAGLTPGADGTYTVPAGTPVMVRVVTPADKETEVEVTSSNGYYSYTLNEEGNIRFANLVITEDAVITVDVDVLDEVTVTFGQGDAEFTVMYQYLESQGYIESGDSIPVGSQVIIEIVRADGDVLYVTCNGERVDYAYGYWVIAGVETDIEIAVVIENYCMVAIDAPDYINYDVSYSNEPNADGRYLAGTVVTISDVSIIGGAYPYVTVDGKVVEAVDGTYTVTVTADTLISISYISIVGISISTLPDKTEYTVGEALDLTGMVVTVTYDNGAVSTAESYHVDPAAGYVFTEDDIGDAFEVLVSIDAHGRIFTVKVSPAAEKVLESIAVSGDYRTEYTEGDDFDTSGMTVTATYTDGSAAEVTGYTVIGGEAMAAGTSEVTVSYTEGDVTVTAPVAVTVTAAEKVLESIAVSGDYRTEYTEGDDFDASGMTVTATYTDGTTAEVTGYTVTGGEAMAAGTSEVTVSYTEGDVTVTAHVAVTVTAAEKVLESIAVSGDYRTEYTEGDDFDASGMTVTATYTDGTTAEVTGYTVTGGEAMAAGTSEVTVSYTEGDVTVTAPVAVTVTAAEPVDIAVQVSGDQQAAVTLSVDGEALVAQDGVYSIIPGTAVTVDVATDAKYVSGVTGTYGDGILTFEESDGIYSAKVTVEQTGTIAVAVGVYDLVAVTYGQDDVTFQVSFRYSEGAETLFEGPVSSGDEIPAGSVVRVYDLESDRPIEAVTFNGQRYMPVMGGWEATADEDIAIAVVFQYIITVTDEQGVGYTLDPEQESYSAGTTVALTVNDMEGHTVSVTIDGEAEEAVNGVYTIVMDADKAVVITAVEDEPEDVYIIVNVYYAEGVSFEFDADTEEVDGAYIEGTVITIFNVTVPDYNAPVVTISGVTPVDAVGGVYTVTVSEDLVVNGEIAIVVGYEPVMVTVTYGMPEGVTFDVTYTDADGNVVDIVSGDQVPQGTVVRTSDFIVETGEISVYYNNIRMDFDNGGVEMKVIDNTLITVIVVVVEEDIVYQDGSHIADGAVFDGIVTVPADATVYVEGDFTVRSESFYLYGSLVLANEAAVASFAAMYAADDSSGATITVCDGATFKAFAGSAIQADISIVSEGTGVIDIADAMEILNINNNVTSSNTYSQTQIVVITETLNLRAGTTTTILGQLLVNDGVVLTVEDEATLVIDSQTAQMIVDGTVIVDDGATILVREADSVTVSGAIESNGTVDIRSTVDVTAGGSILIDDGENSSIAVTDGLTIEAGASITIKGQARFAYIINNGTVTFDGAVLNDDVTISMAADGAVVDIRSFTFDGNDHYLAIADSELEIGGHDFDWNILNIYADPYGGVRDFVVTESITSVTENRTTVYRNHMVLAGNVTIADDSPDAAVENVTINVDGPSFKVVDSLVLGAGVSMVVDTAPFDVSGTVTATASGSSLTSLGGIIDVSGTVTVIEEITRYINAFQYEVAAGNATHYVYTTLGDAVADATENIYAYGNSAVLEDVTIPAGISVRNSEYPGTITIGSLDDRNVTVTVEEDGQIRSCTIDVLGSLYFADKGDNRGNTIYSDVSVIGDDALYTNIYTALANADEGDVVTISRIDGAVVLDRDITVNDGVTLAVPSDKVLQLNDGVTLTVDGILRNSGGIVNITAKTAFAPAASTIAGEEASAIVVNGALMQIAEIEYEYYWTAGAYYNLVNSEGNWNYVAPVETAAEVSDEVTYGEIDIYGQNTVGDVTFTGDEETLVTVSVRTLRTDASPGSENDSVLYAGTVTLHNAALAVYGQFTGNVATPVGEIELVNVTAVGVEDYFVDGTEVMELLGFPQVGDAQGDSPVVAVTSGVVTVGVLDLTYVYTDSEQGIEICCGFSVAEGAEIVVIDRGYDTGATPGLTAGRISIDGTLTVTDGGRVDIDVLLLNGTLNVMPADREAGTLAGSANIDYLFAGVAVDRVDELFTTTGAATVNAENISGLLIVMASADSIVSEALVGDVRNVTEFHIEDSLWLTAYAFDNEGRFILNNVVPGDLADCIFENWTYEADGGYLPVADSDRIGSHDAVYAGLDYQIYTVTVFADPGIEAVYIDGVLMASGWFEESVNGVLTQGFRATVAAGDHEVTYKIGTYYTGEAQMTVNGQAVSGNILTTSGVPVNGDKVEYIVHLQGITAETPEYPDYPSGGDTTVTVSDDGMGITDYLLIVLVVLIVVMAILVAVRMMRS